MRRAEPSRGTRGVTLLELMIAVMLVAVLSLGLLYAMRTALLTYQKINARLDANRRAMGLQQALGRQIGGVIPVTAICNATQVSLFNGAPDSARFVSSYSLAEGSRGYPRIVEYQVQPDPRGGVRLMMSERPYAGPSSLTPMCAGRVFLPVQLTPAAVEIAGPLAYCRFAYLEPNPESPLGGIWFPVWGRTDLPRAVRIEMASLNPNPAALPAVSLNVPIHITRQVGVVYVDP
jgi:prepilin-type N-terminal cleavage/methylation domain-containing protein